MLGRGDSSIHKADWCIFFGRRNGNLRSIKYGSL